MTCLRRSATRFATRRWQRSPGSGRTPVKVWVDTGILCPRADCLFDPSQNFPYPMPPEGGQWVANVEIAFAGSALHAGLQVAQVGQAYVPVLIGYREPLAGWCSGGVPAMTGPQFEAIRHGL